MTLRYLELPAPKPLDRVVRCIWFLRGSDAGRPSISEPQVLVADGRIEIVLHLGDPFVRREDDGSWRPESRTLLAGQLTRPLVVRPNGVTDVVGIRFRTSAAAAFLHLPLAEVTNRVVALADTEPRLARALFEAVARHDDPTARILAIAQVSDAVGTTMPDPLVAALVDSMVMNRSPWVRPAADRSGVSARTLERRVLRATELAPTPLRAVLRFRDAFRALASTPTGRWGRVAVETGYFDQSHLVREFRRFSGVSPSRFFDADPGLARSIMTGGPHPP